MGVLLLAGLRGGLGGLVIRALASTVTISWSDIVVSSTAGSRIGPLPSEPFSPP